jgi:hypothetical protein
MNFGFAIFDFGLEKLHEQNFLESMLRFLLRQSEI